MKLQLANLLISIIFVNQTPQKSGVRTAAITKTTHAPLTSTRIQLPKNRHTQLIVQLFFYNNQKTTPCPVLLKQQKANRQKQKQNNKLFDGELFRFRRECQHERGSSK